MPGDLIERLIACYILFTIGAEMCAFMAWAEAQTIEQVRATRFWYFWALLWPFVLLRWLVKYAQGIRDDRASIIERDAERRYQEVRKMLDE